MQASSVPNLSLLNAVDIRVKMMITALASVMTVATVSYTHLTLPTICSV